MLLTPDSGPAHMATMVGTPVIGLYAATNPARSGPYLSRALVRECLSGGGARASAARAAEQLPWTHKIEEPGVMDLISVDAGRPRSSTSLLGSRAMKDILVPVSPGELLDKITILRIKAARMQRCRPSSPTCGWNSSLLEQTWRDCRLCGAATWRATNARCRHVNERLWDIEDRIRDKEAAQTFDRDFIELARAVYVSNDERAAIKKRVNVALGSRIVEEKSYKPYR